MKIIQTAERVSHQDSSDNYVYQRSLLAYTEAAKIVSGNILEIGTGNAYGIEIISPQANKFVTVDKHETRVLQDRKLIKSKNVEYIKMRVPPLSNIPDNSFDFIITFQVIEHVKRDKEFIKETYRVLKNKGKLIITTPNKKMSLTRNPWHIREYTTNELKDLLLTNFQSIKELGVFGNHKVMEYYRANKETVEKITRFDVFNLQYILPRQLLRIPYDLLNRMNRRRLLNDNNSLVLGISSNDYFLDEASDKCLDLFYIAEKVAAHDKLNQCPNSFT